MNEELQSYFDRLFSLLEKLLSREQAPVHVHVHNGGTDSDGYMKSDAPRPHVS